jgi:hypothetical protein
MKMKILSKSLQLAALSVAVLTAYPSNAAIIWESTTGQIEKLDSPIWLSGAPIKRSLQAFDEEQNVVLPRDIQISIPNYWDNLSDLNVISQGTRVSSHFVYFRNKSREGRNEVRATITFDQPIIGFMGDPTLIYPTNDIFFPNALDKYKTIDPGPGVWRSTDGTLEGLGGNLPADTVTITGDRDNVLQVHFTSRSAVDPLRVITQAPAAPEPLTILGTGTALGLAPFLKRAHSKKRHKDNKKD